MASTPPSSLLLQDPLLQVKTAKTIAFFGSLCLITSNITGPGMVQIPKMFQQTGWFLSTLFFISLGIMSGIVSLYLSKAMQIVPGNRRLQTRWEFEDLAHKFLPKWLHVLGMGLLILNFQSTNISSIVISSQTMDSTLVQIFGKTCGLIMFPFSHGGFTCVNGSTDQDSPFGKEDYVISIGYLAVMVFTLPLGIFNLDENIWVQKISFVGLLSCILLWFIQFIFFSGLEPSRVPFIGDDGIATGITTVLFNYGFIVTLPSWINEKMDDVAVHRVVWSAIGVANCVFLGLGFFGGMGLELPGNEDVTSALTSHDDVNKNILLSSRIAAYVFPFVALLTSIPIFSIIIRSNLIQHRWVSKLGANLFAVVLPWFLALVFYVGDVLTSFINWSAAFLFVGLNFTLPLLIYFAIAKKRKKMAAKVVAVVNRSNLNLSEPLIDNVTLPSNEDDDDDDLPFPTVLPSWFPISDDYFAIGLFILTSGIGLFAMAIQLQQQIQN